MEAGDIAEAVAERIGRQGYHELTVADVTRPDPTEPATVIAASLALPAP